MSGGLLVQDIICGAGKLGFALMDRLHFLGQTLREDAQLPSQPFATTESGHGHRVVYGVVVLRVTDLIVNSVWTQSSRSHVYSQLTDI